MSTTTVPKQTYLVGGAVRDALLGRPSEDRDWVVVGATVAAMLGAGYLQVGRDFPVFLHPQTKDEYALARTERKSGSGHRGFTVHADAGVTLEEDLERRDLTINAIAQAADGELVDPFDGQGDIASRQLRHVSDAFAEDPLRVFRCARLAAQLSPWGFKAAPATNALMRSMADAGALDELSAERVWAETMKALAAPQPQRYFETLFEANALQPWFSEWIAADDDASQPGSPTHSGALIPQAWAGLEATVANLAGTEARYGGLCSALSGAAARALGQRLKAPTGHRDLGILVAELHQPLGAWRTLSDVDLLAVLQRADAARRPERFALLLDIVRAVTGVSAEALVAVAEAVAAVRPPPDAPPKQIRALVEDGRLQAVAAAR